MRRRRVVLLLFALALIGAAAALWGAQIMKKGPGLLAGLQHGSIAVWRGEGKARLPAGEAAAEKPAPSPAPPSPQWLGMQDKKLADDDKCFRLRGLAHNICKCWSAELYGDGRGISRYIYHARGVCENG